MAKFTVRVQPRSSQSKIELRPDGTIKVWISAPPVDGVANDAVVDLLSRKLNVSKSEIDLIRGHQARTKEFEISSMSAEIINERLTRPE